MSYIYDVLANFNESFYDFYDWNESDEIIHIKKIPIIRVDSEFLYNAKNNDIKVDKKNIQKIYRKSDFFSDGLSKMNYVCVISDASSAITLKFDSSGCVTGKSSLLIDEENEVVDIANNLSVSDFSFSILKSKNCDFFKTRKELEICDYIMSQLDSIDDDKLRYLYLDCFDKVESDTKVILSNLIHEIKNNFSVTYGKIYDFLKMTS